MYMAALIGPGQELHWCSSCAARFADSWVTRVRATAGGLADHQAPATGMADRLSAMAVAQVVRACSSACVSGDISSYLNCLKY